MNRVLVVDDDSHVRELARIFLEPEGFRVVEAADGAEAMRVMEGGGADLAILDILMPRVDGYALCAEIRRYYDIPILMLTAKSATPDKIRGFGLGADDYLTKPFDPQELVARVGALMRRYEINCSGRVEIGRTRMDRKAYTVTIAGGAPATFPMKEFELLFMLAGSPGRTFSRETLIEKIWGFDFEGNERTLDVHIGRLRDKLGEEGSGIRIRTIRGVGYRLEETPEGTS
ncbi:MAG: response regulator transcription factor [Clostridiales Family XIII bacterium]|jgi:DNA-binding response OmpR family regulator|nr:response regulator transcription factor [Clostridiales Family XIII bacterium]